MPEPAAPAFTYVLPLRRLAVGGGLGDLPAYLARVARAGEVIVVDGSPPAVRAAHAAALPAAVRHVEPDPPRQPNGKVSNVWTGVRRARAERVVIADDDVRYAPAALAEACALLERADLVCPQNHFEPLPWHAWWDTGRSLLNRVAGGDYPGTLLVRRGRFMRMGGYQGDVLFENLELMRTVAADGGVVLRAPWLHVARRPPGARHFLSQRVRQAYDDLALPGRLLAELALAPALALAAVRAGPRALVVAAGASVALAEAGRRRHGGRAAFSARCAWAAPAWLVERAACAWAAVAVRAVAGGVPYAGARLRRAATPPRALRRRQEVRAARRVAALTPTPTGARRPPAP